MNVFVANSICVNCVVCSILGPRWASWNLGVFLCIRCAGIHRNLGVHISRVKSVNLDSWTPEQVTSLQQMGNSRARAVYEAQMPDNFRRPQTDSALESFIRAKYEHKKYVAREWVQPQPVKVDWTKEIDEEMEKQKRKKKGLGLTSSTNANGKSETSKPSLAKSAPIPAPLPKPTNSSSSPKSRAIVTTNISTPPAISAAKSTSNDTKSYSSDLLGLSTPVNGPSSNNALNSDNANDVFGCFMSDMNSTSNGKPATVPSSTINQPTKDNTSSLEPSLAQQEQDFFNQVPNEKEKAKMTKDSIMALYGAAPPINRLPATNQHFMQQKMQLIGNDTTPFGGLQQQFPQQTAFGPQSTGMNAFPQLGMMQQPQQQQPLNFQQQSHTMNAIPNHMSSTNLSQVNPTLQSFPQPNANQNLSAFASTQNPNAINQQFGNLNLGDVWQ